MRSIPDEEIRANGLSKVEIYNLILDEYMDVSLQEIIDSFLYIASKSQLVVDDEGLQVCPFKPTHKTAHKPPRIPCKIVRRVGPNPRANNCPQDNPHAPQKRARNGEIAPGSVDSDRPSITCAVGPQTAKPMTRRAGAEPYSCSCFAVKSTILSDYSLDLIRVKMI